MAVFQTKKQRFCLCFLLARPELVEWAPRAFNEFFGVRVNFNFKN